MTISSPLHLHMISDSTGETVSAIARSCLAQFDGVVTEQHHWSLIRSMRQLEILLPQLLEARGVVLYTLLDQQLHQKLTGFCAENKLPCIGVIDPVLRMLSDYLQQPLKGQPGRQHIMDAEYFARIAAMDYAMTSDDGQQSHDLGAADVVLLGVSRTSKTPTCLYLANRGIRAANVPLVPGLPLPERLTQPLPALVVGLTREASSLIELRRSRLRLMGDAPNADYVDLEKVTAELAEARRLFSRQGWPVIDVTRRSIEETAAEIIMLLERHRRGGARPPALPA